MMMSPSVMEVRIISAAERRARRERLGVYSANVVKRKSIKNKIANGGDIETTKSAEDASTQESSMPQTLMHRTPTILDIQLAVTHCAGCTFNEMMARRGKVMRQGNLLQRVAMCMRARFISAHIAFQVGKRIAKIARVFKRDHSTIVYILGKAKEMLATERESHALLEKSRAHLRSLGFDLSKRSDCL